MLWNVKHQHILNVAPALRFQPQLPLQFWSDCILLSICLTLPTPKLNSKSPYELFKSKPSYSRLKVLCCLCYASILSQHHSESDPRARMCVSIGYPHGIKGYKLFDLEHNQILIFRNCLLRIYFSLLHKSTCSYIFKC